MTTNITALAAELDRANSSGTAIQQLTAGQPDLGLSDAYEIQHEVVRLRTARGERLVGLKLGMTSKQKIDQMGISEVIIGTLTDGMQVAPGETLDLAGLIHPRAELEVAFQLGDSVADLDLSDAAVDLLDHVTAVAPAIEVIDSRYRDFAFSLPDVVADNTSASRFVVGRWRPIDWVRDTLDLADLRVSLTFDDEVVASGSTGAILGHPFKALEAARRMGAQYGHRFAPGGVLLAGAATSAQELRPDIEVIATIDGLGETAFFTAP